VDDQARLAGRWPIERAQAEGEAIGLSNPQMTAFALSYIKEHQKK
jgi:hypothetical protein